jgi:hypothetical protein
VLNGGDLGKKKKLKRWEVRSVCVCGSCTRKMLLDAYMRGRGFRIEVGQHVY